WSAETVGALAKLRAQTKTSAIVEIKGRPYSVTVNDVVVTMRMNDLHLGDVISLDRVREISTEDYFLRGNPYIYPDFFSIKAVVIEHPVSAEIVRHHWKRRGHQPVHRNRNHYTALRISEIGFKD
ncbi:ribosomal protein L21-like protein, partial [Zopfochytrium polystomum]